MIVAFYTEETPYEQEAKELAANLDANGLPYQIKGVPKRSGWAENCQIKAEFLRRELTRPLLYVDVDARFNRAPRLFGWFRDSPYDIGVHYRNGELLSGTIFLNPTARAKLLLERWVDLNRRDAAVWDQKNLQQAIADMTVNVFRLPAEYCFIFDLMRREYPDASPVIEHFQASRRFKGVV